MESKYLPIGFMDSGIGGLSVLREAVLEMPCENYIFYGDNGNAPYGEKSEDEIFALTLKCGEHLMNEGIKMLVIACNTMTTIAVHALRDRYNIPVISIEPAIKPALTAPDSRKVIVMATPATISQNRYLSLKNRVGHSERLIDIPCSGLAGLIEKGHFDSDEIAEYVEDKLIPFRNEDISGLVIGCTHYSFITPLIKKISARIFGHEIGIYDGLYGTVKQINRVLFERSLLNDSGEHGTIRLMSSGDDRSIELMKNILDSKSITD